MIQISDTLFIAEDSLDWAFMRSSGPGGQNVNKVETAVQLRFDTVRAGLSEGVRLRFLKKAGQRVTSEGVLVIEAQRFRSQERNRRDAWERLVALLRLAEFAPAKRVKTRPSLASKERRLEGKRQRAEVKKGRGGKWEA